MRGGISVSLAACGFGLSQSQFHSTSLLSVLIAAKQKRPRAVARGLNYPFGELANKNSRHNGPAFLQQLEEWESQFQIMLRI